MFSKAFWKATAERAVATAAQSAIAVIVVDTQVDAFMLDWRHVAGVAAGGAVLAVLKALAAGVWNPLSGPSFGPERLRQG